MKTTGLSRKDAKTLLMKSMSESDAELGLILADRGEGGWTKGDQARVSKQGSTYTVEAAD